MPRLRPVAVATAVLLLAACGPTAQERTTTSDEIALPHLGWADADGRRVTLPTEHYLQGHAPDVRPGQPVLVNFWASTCGPCRAEMPLLQHLADDGVAVVGVTRDRFDDYALRAIHKADVSYPNVQDADASWMDHFSGLVPLSFIPSSVVIVDGKVTRVHIGPFHKLGELDEVRAPAHS